MLVVLHIPASFSADVASLGNDNPNTATAAELSITTNDVSRPTLVRLLEKGDIPMSKPGRHRYVQLQDLVTYQETMQQRRRAVLDTMAREAEESGLYDATDGLPPRTR